MTKNALFSSAEVLGDNLLAAADVQTNAAGPVGALPLTEKMLRDWPSGDIFGLTQNAGMGWPATEMLGPQFVLLSTQGGIRDVDGTPIALGYHTGHWEVGLAGAGRGARTEGRRRRAVCRLLFRSLRRSHARNDRHVR